MSGQDDNSDGQLKGQKLWEKYEDIAMHFNDLLMRLRSQSLAGIAAVSTLVGIFTKTGVDAKLDWLAATAIFIAMGLFWCAIFFLDIYYYNRLLVGAVAAITKLESNLLSGEAVSIDMSTLIAAEFNSHALRGKAAAFRGVLSFYAIVFFVILAGILFSFCMYRHSP